MSQSSHNKEGLSTSEGRPKDFFLAENAGSQELQERVNLDKEVLSLFWVVQGEGSGEKMFYLAGRHKTRVTAEWTLSGCKNPRKETKE